MAKYRQLQTKFWSDPFIEGLTPEQKYFYMYLLTNPATTQCGIYEITIKTMSFQTGYNNDTVEKLLDFFERKKKVKYSKNSSELFLMNFKKHNWTTSPKVIACIERELSQVKDRTLVTDVYGMDTISQEKEKEKKEEKEKQKMNEGVIPILEIKKSTFFNQAKNVCEFFGLQTELHPEKYNLCCDFFEQLNKQEKLEYFDDLFSAYKKYKSHSGEKIHGFHSFLGSKSKGFIDGGWNSNNWFKKLSNLKSKERSEYKITEEITNFKFK